MRNTLIMLRQGFNPAEVAHEYGDTLTFWDWKERNVTQSIKLGADGLIPLVCGRARSARALVGYCAACSADQPGKWVAFQKAEVRCCP